MMKKVHSFSTFRHDPLRRTRWRLPTQQLNNLYEKSFRLRILNDTVILSHQLGRDLFIFCNKQKYYLTSSSMLRAIARFLKKNETALLHNSGIVLELNLFIKLKSALESNAHRIVCPQLFLRCTPIFIFPVKTFGRSILFSWRQYLLGQLSPGTSNAFIRLASQEACNLPLLNRGWKGSGLLCLVWKFAVLIDCVRYAKCVIYYLEFHSVVVSRVPPH